MTVGSNLRRLRRERELEQAPLAKLAGSSQQTISEIENDKRDPRESTLVKLAGALGVPVGAFFADGDGATPPIPPRPRTPLTDEPEGGFDQRFAATDAESAEALQAKMGGEFDAIRAYVKQLKAAGVGDFKVRQARRSLAEARRRTYAVTSRATDLAINADLGGDRKVHDTVAEYVGAALEVDASHGEEQARHDSAKRVEQSGKAG
jgi:transcriptional regulator with XRE-family HTH domain